MRLQLFAPVVSAVALAALGASMSLAASTLSCIEEIGVPAARMFIMSAVPASAQVTVTIGADGRAEGAIYNASPLLQLDLAESFVEKARYSVACKGQRLTFEVRYEVVGEATWHAESVTQFLPPNKFVVICHPVKGSVN